MPLSRLLLNHRRWILSIATVLFFVGQLGSITHSLHLGSNAKVEIACGFCATAHASMDGPRIAPSLPFAFTPVAASSIDRSVLLSFDFPASARARAPPLV
jgi:hypothetical protein